MNYVPNPNYLEILFNIIRCPKCHGTLSKLSNTLCCNDCGNTYTLFLDKIPNFNRDTHELSFSEGVESRNLEEQAKRIHCPDWRNIYNIVRIEKVLSLIEGSLLLDIGAADGQIASYISKKLQCVCIALEKSVEWLNIHKTADVPFVLSDLYSMPFADSVFDSIFMGEVLEHLYDPKDAIMRALPMLKPNGVLVGTVPNFAFWQKRITYLRGKFGEDPQNPLQHEHIRFFNATYLRNLLISCNMRDVLIIGVYNKTTSHRKIMETLALKHPNLFAYTLVFRARK